jgi:cold shock CspA family protein/ribosome-associated translation inhibitor RaiA
MDRPVEIVFHNLPSSPAVEAEIRERIAKLERRYDHLIGCRVAVEKLHRQHQTGNLYDVHIELKVPGTELAVTREPHRAKQRYARPDLHASLRDAFAAAERRLTDYKRQQRGEVKPREEFFVGQVSQLYPAEDHGFILTHEGTQLYFHRSSLMEGGFDKLRVGDRVQFVEIDGDTGPIARKVWPAAGGPG